MEMQDLRPEDLLDEIMSGDNVVKNTPNSTANQL
jgi:hypothetical protein